MNLTAATLSGLALAALAVGCSKTSTVQVAGPVGPTPGAGGTLEPGRGALVVYTSPEMPADNDYGPEVRAPYTVFDVHGHMVARVDSHSYTAQLVALDPGVYTVRTQGFGGRMVELNAEVVGGKTTEVFLDDAVPPPPDRRASIIRGPDGSFVGWSAPAMGGGPKAK
jgi:hypothetical protein